jgi:hypothetical protein
MQNTENRETAEIWRAAQHRRTEDITGWLGRFLKRSDEMPSVDISRRSPKPHLALARGLTIAVITLAAVTSVSAVVDAKRPSHGALRPTGPMPAVNVP